MYYRTKTPGSLMIMGEHSVLHGYPSIVAAIDKYVHVTVKRGELGKVRIESDYFGVYETDIKDPVIARSEATRQSISPNSSAAKFDIILAILARYKHLLADGVEIQIKSDFSPELGLGSSGALIVGLVSALMMMFGKEISKQELLKESLVPLQQVRSFASGSDLAASIYKGVVYFDPKTCTARRIAEQLPILVAYSGYKTKTDEVIDKINKEFQGHELKRIYSEAGRLTELAEGAIRNKNYVELGKLMNAANSTVYEPLNLITDELRTIVAKFIEQDFVYGAKVSGAGLGDCAIAITNDEQDYSGLKGLQIIPVTIAAGLSKADIVNRILCNSNASLRAQRGNRSVVCSDRLPRRCAPRNDDFIKNSATAFAPSNIAICKYWGKRNEELHLPANSSLSISLDSLGSRTTISTAEEDSVSLNGELLNPNSSFVSKIFNFVDLFRSGGEMDCRASLAMTESREPVIARSAATRQSISPQFMAKGFKFAIDIESTIPIAAGLASSAAGFAALVLALNDLFDWQLTNRELSILARLGSGSAARSIERGFVQWHKGERADGMDSYAEKLPLDWPGLSVGILMVDGQEKHMASREAMRLSKETSPDFKSWVQQSEHDLALMIAAIEKRDFLQFGKLLEENSNRMHKVMASSKPSIIYSTAETDKLVSKIKFCREELGLPVFYTQDAGPNLVIFFEENNTAKIKEVFSNDSIVFSETSASMVCSIN